jgi:dynein heavy chain
MDSLRNNKNRLSGHPKHPVDQNQSGNVSFIERLSCTYREGDDEDSSEMKMESPTRRYKKRTIDIKKEMLGAGVDPLNKDQDFSVLAKTGKNLMGAHFIKPGASKTRFPPVINVFSRTLASPICSSPFPLPLPHRIASNLSRYCIGLYIHEEKKMLLFENTFLHSFEAASEFSESLATEKEEVIYGSSLLYDEQ